MMGLDRVRRITRCVLLPLAALIGTAALSGCYIYPDRPYGGGGGGGYGYGGGGYGYHAPYYYR